VVEVAQHSIEQLADLTWRGFFVNNLLPVTLGNLFGGTIMVAAVYWYVYLRCPPEDRASLHN
jgi:formate/nitrite transporter FocA (FNT family)